MAVMEQLYTPMGGVSAALTMLQAIAMLVFALLYTPCVAAMTAIRQELGTGWAVRVGFGMLGVAWLVAFAARLVGMAIGLT